MKSKFKWAIAYLISVIAFCFIYFGYWIYKPDSFIINQDLNVQPITDINQFLLGDGDKYEVGSFISLSDIKKSYDADYKKIKTVLIELDKLNKSKEELSGKLKTVSQKRFEEIDYNFSLYEKRTLEPFLTVEREIAKKINELERALPKKIESQADLDKVKEFGEAKIELASAKVKTAHQAVENSHTVLNNMRSFTNRETIEELHRIQKLEKNYYEEWRRLERAREELRVNAIDNIRQHQRLIIEKVNFFDFLFYSVGISTTTTFGDLVPNDRVVKSFVSLQLLVCIFILGGFVNAVLKS